MSALLTLRFEVPLIIFGHDVKTAHVGCSRPNPFKKHSLHIAPLKSDANSHFSFQGWDFITMRGEWQCPLPILHFYDGTVLIGYWNYLSTIIPQKKSNSFFFHILKGFHDRSIPHTTYRLFTNKHLMLQTSDWCAFIGWSKEAIWLVRFATHINPGTEIRT